MLHGRQAEDADRAPASQAALLDELEALLREVAAGLQPNRAAAVAYLECRSALLDSPIKGLLPGFLYQCGTVAKFRDFVSLYDPDADLRCAFIASMFARCRELLARGGPATLPPRSQAGRWDWPA